MPEVVGYRLDGRTPVAVYRREQLQYGEPVAQAWFGLPEAEGSAHVSTVFLPIDHNFSGVGPPVLFETMVFWHGHELEEACERYCTWEEAEEGHLRMVQRVGQAWAARS